MIVGLLVSIISGLFSLFYILVAVALAVKVLSEFFCVIAAVLWIVFIFVAGHMLDKGMRKKWGVSLSQDDFLPPIPFIILTALEVAFGFFMVIAAILSRDVRILIYIAISLVIYVALSILLMNRKYKKIKERETNRYKE